MKNLSFKRNILSVCIIWLFSFFSIQATAFQYNREEINAIKSLADKGNGEALYVLYEAYDCSIKGIYEIEPDSDLAEQYLKKSTESGYPRALYELGIRLEPQMGLKYIEAAANKDYPDALYLMARIYSKYYKIYGIKQNDKKAIEYFKKAEKSEDAEVLCWIARVYQWGEMPESHSNMTSAINLFKKSVEKGYNTSASYLEGIYKHGDGVPADESEAKKWKEIAITRSDLSDKELLAQKQRLGLNEKEEMKNENTSLASNGNDIKIEEEVKIDRSDKIARTGIVFTKDGVEYEVINRQNKTLAVVGGRPMGSVTIPSSIAMGAETYTVTVIDIKAFEDCPTLITISLPTTLISIEYSAFAKCENLTNVNFPNSLQYIGPFAFEKCKSLTTANLPSSIRNMGTAVFQNCSSLTSATLPSSIGYIANSTFAGCSSLTSITIPTSVDWIGIGAFGACESLKSITIPNSVTYIGERAFINCQKLTSVTIPNSVDEVGNGVFSFCRNLTSVKLSNKLEKISAEMFLGCKRLSSITIPNSVTVIGYKSFMDCIALQSIVLPPSVTKVDRQAFYGCTSLTSVTVPPGLLQLRHSDAFGSCPSIRDFLPSL